jgi:small-conductance mechanosensitive channel
VTRVNLLSTRLRTPRNEEVTIPNSVILSASVTNYSTLAGQRGLVLQAEVGIGYETPWRQVHAMLLEAARRTSWAMADPAPFIVQRSLGDFAVVYQLNVCRPRAEGLLQAQTELNQHILDVFNEYGVQIMTPAYEADPPQPKVVAKSDWYLPPAAPPAAADRRPPAGE